MSKTAIVTYCLTLCAFSALSIFALDGGFYFLCLLVVFAYTLVTHLIVKVSQISEIFKGIIVACLCASMPLAFSALFYFSKALML